MANLFRKNVRRLNQEIGANVEENVLTKDQKNQLFRQTKLYIFLQELLDSLKNELAADEHIRAYLPLTTDGSNLSFMNVGYMGLHHPKTQKARDYVKDFNDLRGNRLLVFTDQRLLFLTIIEYLDQGLFYSYPYEEIQVITLKKIETGYFDWSDGFPGKRKKTISYYIDFECGSSIFSELVEEADANLFMEQQQMIEKMTHIEIEKSVHRKHLFDFLINNFHLGYKISISVWFIMVLLFVLFFLAAALFHIGPMVHLLPK